MPFGIDPKQIQRVSDEIDKIGEEQDASKQTLAAILAKLDNLQNSVDAIAAKTNASATIPNSVLGQITAEHAAQAQKTASVTAEHQS